MPQEKSQKFPDIFNNLLTTQPLKRKRHINKIVKRLAYNKTQKL